MAIAAITIEVSRLTDTATEVQVAVDAAALAAAENMLKGGNVDSAKAAARTVAAQNRTDGRGPAPGDVRLEFGSYTIADGFSAGGADNAVRATVTISNVRYLLASVFGSGTNTAVTKRAVATYECCGYAQPGAPITIGDCQLLSYLEGQPCSTRGYTLVLQPQQAQNSCWTAGPGTALDWLPPECGGGRAPLVSAGETIQLKNGNMTPILKQFQNCVDHGIHDYVIPITRCPIGNWRVCPCNRTKGRRTWPVCAPQPTMPGRTARASRISSGARSNASSAKRPISRTKSEMSPSRGLG